MTSPEMKIFGLDETNKCLIHKLVILNFNIATVLYTYVFETKLTF